LFVYRPCEVGAGDAIGAVGVGLATARVAGELGLDGALGEDVDAGPGAHVDSAASTTIAAAGATMPGHRVTGESYCRESDQLPTRTLALSTSADVQRSGPRRAATRGARRSRHLLLVPADRAPDEGEKIVRYVQLGKTDLTVSAIAFGTWSFGGDWGAFDADDAKRTVGRALDLGITFFDTAQAYGFGASESLLADALWSRVGRDHVVIATKGGLRKEGDTLHRDASARWLRAGVEASLRNLRTDHIDLYQVHWPDPKTPAEETGRVLADLVREGKIRHAGVSNYSPQQMTELARHGPVETDQPPYHMFHRDIEADVLPFAAQNEIGVLVYGPLAHGLLSGTMTSQTKFAADDWRGSSTDFKGEKFARDLEVVDHLKQYAAAHEITLPQLAIAWTISNPAVDVAIVGARQPAHLSDPAAAADIGLSESDRAEIDGILSNAVEIVGPAPEAMP
jgi:aryl-alcohol dehydrogenase-like predicted oxidoreductase